MFGFLKRLFRGSAPRPTPPVASAQDVPQHVLPPFPPPAFDLPPEVLPQDAAPVMAAPLPELAQLPLDSMEPEAPAERLIEPSAYHPEASGQPAPLLDTGLLDEDEDAPGMVAVPGVPGAYMVGLVGEEDHAEAVSMLNPGMTIWLQLEPDNPHDQSAIAAVDPYGRVIGYIAPDSWLREAVYGGGASYVAQVLAAETGARGYREVVLMVEPSELALSERRYQAPAGR